MIRDVKRYLNLDLILQIRKSTKVFSCTVFRWTGMSCAAQCLKLDPVCWASMNVLYYNTLFSPTSHFWTLGDLTLQRVSESLLEFNTTRNCWQQGKEHQIQSNINFLCGKTLVSLNNVLLSSMEMTSSSDFLLKETCCIFGCPDYWTS